MLFHFSYTFVLKLLLFETKGERDHITGRQALFHKKADVSVALPCQESHSYCDLLSSLWYKSILDDFLLRSLKAIMLQKFLSIQGACNAANLCHYVALLPAEINNYSLIFYYLVAPSSSNCESNT